MALIPRVLRPSVIIRRKAMYSGVLGNSGFWKLMAVYVFGKGTLKKFFGKNPETIDVSKLRSGRYMEIVTTKPLTRRERKRLRRAGTPAPTLAQARAEAASLAETLTRPAS